MTTSQQRLQTGHLTIGDMKKGTLKLKTIDLPDWAVTISNMQPTAALEYLIKHHPTLIPELFDGMLKQYIIALSAKHRS